MQLAVLALLALFVLFHPPPTTADSELEGVSSIPQSEWGDKHSDAWSEAMDIVSVVSPSTASGIADAVANGSLAIVEVQNPIPADDDYLAGKTDCDTLGVELDDRRPEDAAATIIHEWTHFTGMNGEPPEEPGPCAEARAYAAQADALSDISCESVTPPTCAEVSRVNEKHEANAAACEASGGTPVEPQGNPSCGCV